MTPEDVHRRRANKLFNERVKLLATFFNNTGIATLVGGFLLPIFNGSRLGARQALVIFGFGLCAYDRPSRPDFVSERGLNMDALLILPAGLVLFGLGMLFWLRHESAALDRRFGKDSPDSAS